MTPELLPLPDLLERQAHRCPDRPLIEVIGERSSTYGETWMAALAVSADLIELGVRRRSPVVIMARPCLKAIHAWLGVSCAGAIDVPINTAYIGFTLEHAINQTGAEVIVLEDHFLPALRAIEDRLSSLKHVLHFHAGDEASESLPSFERLTLRAFEDSARRARLERAVLVEPRDIATIVYTSGTTGPPKGVMMPYGQTALIAHLTVAATEMNGQDIFYCFHPLYHMAAKFVCFQAALSAGATFILDRKFEPGRWLDQVRDHRATITLGHGPMLEMIFAQPPREEDRDHRLRSVIAAPLPQRIGTAFEDRFDVKAVEVWGATEIGAVSWTSLKQERVPGSCGRADPALFEVKIFDPETDQEMPDGSTGEFVLRPRLPWTIMQGYLNDAEATVVKWRNLWFHTGDHGYRDAESNLFFVDRASDRIRRRAENISAGDIEAAAVLHPAITEAAAIAVPSEFEHDDDIKICVVSRPGATIGPAEVLDHLLAHLPHSMAPRYVEFLEALPRNPLNKVQKAALRTAGLTEATWDRKRAGYDLRRRIPQRDGISGEGGRT
jgi:crotonobetaine/carnitine-CoA ligase